jgi:hypothetical protein
LGTNIAGLRARKEPAGLLLLKLDVVRDQLRRIMACVLRDLGSDSTHGFDR